MTVLATEKQIFLSKVCGVLVQSKFFSLPLHSQHGKTVA